MPSSSGYCRLAMVGVVLQISGLALFVIGFFPVKPALPGVSGPETYDHPTCNLNLTSPSTAALHPHQLRSLYKEMSGIPPAYDRLILMVIDGLPAEFVIGREGRPPSKEFDESMPFTQYLLSNGNAIGYRTQAAPPTVTMPRLKAIVSGAIGGYLDVAFNFNTKAFLDDNLLEQLHRIGWKMVMLGDDTWIKLFPTLFSRQDGVHSFFVKDTVEVDFNVSRHLTTELAAYDWNLLILHYLGLDHVGHAGGRHCGLMAPKLREMDDVIHKIYTSGKFNHDSDGKRTLLMVVSDHGMTDAGNHGGSSYEETDSLALFIGLGDDAPRLAPISRQAVFQVDIAPTLALLFGVPIPKNNVGVLLPEALDLLTEEQTLRAFELNSWQLLRILNIQLPGLLCCGDSGGCAANRSDTGKLSGSVANRLRRLYLKAMDLHKTWKLLNNSQTTSDISNHFSNAVEAYRDFLETSSQWVSHRATDKPIILLAAGSCIMLASSFILLNVLFSLISEVKVIERKLMVAPKLKEIDLSSRVDEYFIIIGVVLHTFSLGASSMVEEEQYIWHFLASTLYLIFLYRKVQTCLVGQAQNKTESVKEENIFCHSFKNGATYDSNSIQKRYVWWDSRSCFQICCLLVVLICGRILRGWHQGGVNWTHLPDISKWLEESGAFSVKALQLFSLFVIILGSSFFVYLVQSRGLFFLILTSHFTSGLLTILRVTGYKFPSMFSSIYTDESIVKTLLAILLLTVVAILSYPWFSNVNCQSGIWGTYSNLRSSGDTRNERLLCIQECAFVIGEVLISSWCILQLLLQNPLNAIPVMLLFVQIQASITYFMSDGSYHGQWVKVTAMYFMGMAGHFGLGNSNSIATVDVAGAFRGLSSYSVVLAGITMFLITYASPLLFFFGSIICFPASGAVFTLGHDKSELKSILPITIGIYCLVPLVLNSITLTSFTIVLLLMRNHLFVWSVFSPKYLYISAATVSVYIGTSIVSATSVYICNVVYLRVKRS